MFNWRYLNLLALAALSLNCFNEPLAPVMPTWDTQLTVPLGSRTYTLGELIAKDSALLKVGTGNQVVIAKSVQVKPTYVNDLLSISPKDTSVQIQLGAFTVTAADQRTPVDIPWLPKGFTIPVPDTTMSLSDVQSKIESFESMTVKSGTISLTLENKLPVAMNVLSPIRLVDLSGNVMATFTFNPATIPAFGSRSASDNLSGKAVTSDYRITGLQFHTPGSATPVQIPNGDLLVGVISTSNLKATQATLSDIPSQSLTSADTAKLRIDDSTLVREIHLKSGGMSLSFRNNIAVGMRFKVKFNELMKRVGSTYVSYEDSIYLAPNGTGSLPLNLSGTRIRSANGNLINSLNVLGSVSIPASKGPMVTISETDKVLISMTKTSNLVVDSAVGVLKPTWVNVDSRIGLNLGTAIKKFSGNVNIPAAQLGLATISSIGFPADAYVKIGARKANGDSVFLNLPASQRRLMPGQDGIQFDAAEVGSFLSQLASQLPDSLRISGRILVNPHDVYTPSTAGVGTVGSNSSVSGSLNVSLPLTVGIQDGSVRDTLVIGDSAGTKATKIDPATINRYNRGKVYIELENGLPAELSFSTGLLDHAKRTLLAMPQSGSPILLRGAQVDADGNVTVPGKSTTVIELNQQEVSQYNPAAFVSYNVALKTSNGAGSVTFRSDNKVKIRVWSTLSVKVQ
jgi:hypothetical protein